MPTTIEQLYSPVAVPSPLGETPQPTGSPQTWGTQEQSELVTALMGTETTDVTPKSGTTTETPTTNAAAPPATSSPGGPGMTSKMLGMENVGSNVGGVVGSEAIDRSVKNVEAIYEVDTELSDIESGAEGIYTKGGKLKTGKAGAREAKQQDRKQDRADRKQAKKDCRAAGGSRKACRKAKGAERKRERKMRRATFDEYQAAEKKAGREAKGK